LYQEEQFCISLPAS